MPFPHDPHRTPAALADRFARFASFECATLPLYHRLCTGIAEDADLLRLAAAVPRGQPLPNLFLAAVHYLLLDEPRHPLARFYPTLNGSVRTSGGDPFPDFRAFALERHAAIGQLLRTRRVQTNEVARCATLLPGVALVAEHAAGHPLAWLELGSSAGLNLNWDRYAYDYGDGRIHGDATSPIRLRCAVRGNLPPPVPTPFPTVVWRLGLDLHPVHVDDEDQALWLRALVFPDHPERSARLRAAMEVARRHPPTVMQGDVLTALATVAVPPGLHLCVTHTYMANQLSSADRARLDEAVADLARRRSVSRLSIEWLKGAEYPELELYLYSRASRTGGRLARCHWHAEWLEWTAG